MTCEIDRFAEDLADLSSAEEFLDYFAIDFDARVVQVNRLHILQRFHDYLAKQEAGKVRRLHRLSPVAGAGLRRLRHFERTGRKSLRRLPEGRRFVVPPPLVADGLRPCSRAGTTGTPCG
jgi:hypothetical protein